MKLTIKVGSIILHKGVVCKVKEIKSMTDLVVEKEDKVEDTVKISEVRLLSTDSFEQEELSQISEERWKIAEYRFSAISTLLDRVTTLSDVKEISEKENVSVASLYRWRDKYLESGRLLTSLLPAIRPGGKGKSRLDDQAEKLLLKIINDHYLTPLKRSMISTYKELGRICHMKKIPCPSFATLRSRIISLEQYEVLKKRYGKRAADEKFKEKTGNFPDANYPLETVQIDHTRLDMFVIDPETTVTLGKPWLTLAIDVFSRMVVGYCVGFESPSILTTGICLSNAILPKDEILREFNIEVEWPCWGVMKSVHTDNGADFHSDAIKRACAQYGIESNFRPLAKPEYGGHIERYIGTIKNELNDVNGTTFNDFRKRKNYNSEKNAILTLPDLEEWIVTFITEIYHVRSHSGIGTSPLRKYKLGVYGDDETPGIGVPMQVVDSSRLRIDFLPFYERTIQDYGVALDGVMYYSDVLRSYINSVEYPDPKKSLTVKRKFVFRRDPRDISKLYFFDPEFKRYFSIPYRNSKRPTMSLWELRASKKYLKQKEEDIDEDAIFKAYDKLRKIESNAAKQKRKLRYSASKPDHQAESGKTESFNTDFDLLDLNDIKPFDL